MRLGLRGTLFVLGAMTVLPGIGSAGFDEGVKALRMGNETAALEEFRSAAEAGHAAAQYNLGIMHLRGSGVPKDLAAGLGWLAESADNGDVAAMSLLGALYIGRGEVPQDFDKSLRYLAAAAARGDAIAQNNLAVMHLYGWGTPVDRVAAYHWAMRAERGGLEQAVTLRQAIAAQITPTELAEAERRLAQALPPAPPAPSVAMPASPPPAETPAADPPASAVGDSPAPPSPADTPVAAADPAPPAPEPEPAPAPPAAAAPSPPPPAPVLEPENSKPQIPDAAPPATPAPKPAVFRAHLASVRGQKAAEGEWLRIRRIGKRLLGGMTPIYEEVDLGEKGTYMRLYVGAFPDYATAAAFCESLIAGKLKCRPVRVR